MTEAQLSLFASNGSMRPLSNAEVGLVQKIGPGAGRLLGELVKRGLAQEHLMTAAALVVALDSTAGER